MKTHFSSVQLRLLKRLKLGLSYCLSVASILAISSEAIARPDPAETAPLRLQPVLNLNHTEGAGFTGFTSVGGFLPIFQTPGQNVTFLDGRVIIDNEGNFGGGLQAGYRTLLNDSTIWGAYAGVDARTASDRTFTQAGFGTELLGENWDLTLNANLPLGNARQVLSSDTQAANPQFNNNQLLIDEQQVSQIEAALTTVSLDAGLELFDFGKNSSLWGRGGVYYLGGEASQDSLGFRASLDYRPQNNVRLGLGVQNDGIFDTNVVFSVNASLGSSSQPAYDAEDTATEENSAEDSPSQQHTRNQLWARAAEPITRTNTVLTERRTDIDIIQSNVVAINPETNQAFVFNHVDPVAGAAGANGSIEAPLDTIANAAAISTANADNIIFVQAGNVGGAFTLPDGVQVRSVGPTQALNTQFGEIVLPGSGSGNLPVVSGTLTIGNNTLVSGLEINPDQIANDVETVEVTEAVEAVETIETVETIDALEASALVSGIVVRGEGITITDNVITNADQGINLPDVEGTVTIARNTLSNITGDGIFFGDLDGESRSTITIANNTFDTIGDEGIEFDLIKDSAIADITIANNQLSNVQSDNIFLDDIENSAVATILVSQNVIEAADGSEGDGIEFDRIENNATANITVENNQINNVAFEGIEFDDIENNAIANITVSNNQISSGETGIEFDVTENEATVNISVIGNTITVAAEEGILFEDIEDNAVADITIENNTILSAATQGIEFELIEDNANATISILNNQISNVGEEGILIEHSADTDFCLALDQNTVTTPGSDGFELLSNGSGQFQILDLVNLTQRNTGTFNPADIASNNDFVNGKADMPPCP